MLKLKPVWRLNMGDGVPSDLGAKFMYFYNISIFEASKNPHLKNSSSWKFYGDRNDIAAYQTNRTKTAKFERVECDGCDGSGFATDFNGGDMTVYEDEICPDCNGRGYIWKNYEIK